MAALITTHTFAQNGNLDGGTLTYGEKETANQFNPYLGKKARAVTIRLFSMIFEGLVRYDFDTDRIVPVLAQSWETSSDNRQITFHLHPNIKWHDGENLSPDDVYFTYQFIKLRGRNRIKRKYSFIDRMEIKDRNSITFIFKEPEPDALKYFDARIIPAHRFDEHFLEKKYNVGTFSQFPIGTGPYKFVSKGLNGKVTLVVNKNYWGKRAHINSVIMKTIADETTMVNSLIYGGIKLIVDTPPNAIAKIQNAGEFDLIPYRTFSFHAFGYNCQNSLLKNPSVRRAFSMAVDREKMLNQWYAGKGYILFGPFVKASSYYHTELTPLPFLPMSARKILDDLGIRDHDGDGYRETQDGKKINLKLVVPVEQAATTPVIQNVAQSYINYLKNIGIKVSMENVTMDDYLDKIFYKHDFDIAWVQWTFGTSYDISDLFYSSENQPGGNNFISYNNPKIDILIKDFHQTNDKETRRSIMYRIQEILRDDCPYTFLYTIDNYAAVHYSIVTNRHIDPYYFFTFLPEWYIPADFR